MLFQPRQWVAWFRTVGAVALFVLHWRVLVPSLLLLLCGAAMYAVI